MASNFLTQYYTKWAHSPNLLYKFYSPTASFAHATTYTLDDLSVVKNTPATPNAIQDWMDLNPVSVKVDMESGGTVDALMLPGDESIVICVKGMIVLKEGDKEAVSTEGEQWRSFSQTFVLSKEVGKWKVISDIFRLWKGEGDELPDSKSAPKADAADAEVVNAEAVGVKDEAKDKPEDDAKVKVDEVENGAAAPQA
eukprot:CAMPEP_0118650502 /NCGR_PEP_ID=MMETSP0785-20121206/10282_1 /TAXON_ID=91992 /ORGANISM="Bolidomonas pacifica, Strain CCMP 1866" /LENGTH=196 /DNA_ID=CAMNT_0006542883 /DNA_START=17 /DNA_END=604 /DNA_ORIENTATION=-